MSSITPHYRTISQLLNSRQFSIDEYQREDKWGRQHIVELVTDLLGKFNSSYYLGDLPSAASRYADVVRARFRVKQVSDFAEVEVAPWGGRVLHGAPGV